MSFMATNLLIIIHSKVKDLRNTSNMTIVSQFGTICFQSQKGIQIVIAIKYI